MRELTMKEVPLVSGGNISGYEGAGAEWQQLLLERL